MATAQILAILRIPLSLVMFGFALAFAVVPASELRDWLCEFREIQAAGG